MSSSMEQDLGPVTVHYPFHAGSIAHRADENRQFQIGVLTHQLHLDLIGVIFVNIKDYQFDVVKIDMRFLSNLENNEKARTLIDCIIQMANRIHMLTLTEGVETETQMQLLKKMGCELVQGYYFSRPLPASEFEKSIIKDCIDR